MNQTVGKEESEKKNNIEIINGDCKSRHTTNQAEEMEEAKKNWTAFALNRVSPGKKATEVKWKRLISF